MCSSPISKRKGSAPFGQLIVAILGLTNCADSALAQENEAYSASGYQEVHNEHGKSYTNTFNMTVAPGGKWLLDLLDSNDRWPRFPGKRPGIVEVPAGLRVRVGMGFDGTDTYYVRDVALPPDSDGAIQYVPYSSYISTGPMPMAPGFPNDGRGVLWMAFAGGSHMRGVVTSTLPLPWKNPRRSLLAYGFRFEARFDRMPPYTLQSAEFYRDESLDLDEEGELNRPELDYPKDREEYNDLIQQLKTRRSFWREGDLVARYTVSEERAFHGWNVPIISTLKRFSGKDTNIYTEHRIIVTNLVLSSNVTFRPDIKEYVRMVEDTRFRHRDERRARNKIMYSAGKGNDWRPKDDPSLKQMFNDSLLLSRRYNHRWEIIKRYGFITILFLFGVVAPFLLYRRRRNGMIT